MSLDRIQNPVPALLLDRTIFALSSALKVAELIDPLLSLVATATNPPISEMTLTPDCSWSLSLNRRSSGFSSI